MRRKGERFFLIAAALRLEKGLDLLCKLTEDVKPFGLSKTEWSCLHQLYRILGWYKTTSDKLCGEKYPTLPTAVAAFNIFLDRLELTAQKLEEKASRSVVDEIMLHAIRIGRDKMLKHYRKFNWIYCMALVLDPRFKKKGFSKSSWGKELQESSLDKFHSIYRKYVTSSPSKQRESIPKHRELDNFFDDIDFESIYEAPKKYNNEFDQEIEDYLESPVEHEETDILLWWKINCSKYPTIAKMAKDYLSIPATSVPVERVFSESGSVLTPKRCNLSKEKVNALVCIKLWMKSVLKKQICQVDI